MQLLTQVGLNCWQTCVAMLLDCPPGQLPDQLAIKGPAYDRALLFYLGKHHGLTIRAIDPSPSEANEKFHLIVGESIRTTPENDTWHAIIGFSGKPYWDVHPSRAGLTRIFRFGILDEAVPNRRLNYEACLCPSCQAEQKHAGMAAFYGLVA